jgi:hypothetical protein
MFRNELHCNANKAIEQEKLSQQETKEMTTGAHELAHSQPRRSMFHASRPRTWLGVGTASTVDSGSFKVPTR